MLYQVKEEIVTQRDMFRPHVLLLLLLLSVFGTLGNSHVLYRIVFQCLFSRAVRVLMMAKFGGRYGGGSGGDSCGNYYFYTDDEHGYCCCCFCVVVCFVILYR